MIQIKAKLCSIPAGQRSTLWADQRWSVTSSLAFLACRVTPDLQSDVVPRPRLCYCVNRLYISGAYAWVASLSSLLCVFGRSRSSLYLVMSVYLSLPCSDTSGIKHFTSNRDFAWIAVFARAWLSRSPLLFYFVPCHGARPVSWSCLVAARSAMFCVVSCVCFVCCWVVIGFVFAASLYGVAFVFTCRISPVWSGQLCGAFGDVFSCLFCSPALDWRHVCSFSGHRAALVKPGHRAFFFFAVAAHVSPNLIYSHPCLFRGLLCYTLCEVLYGCWGGASSQSAQSSSLPICGLQATPCAHRRLQLTWPRVLPVQDYLSKALKLSLVSVTGPGELKQYNLASPIRLALIPASYV